MQQTATVHKKPPFCESDDDFESNASDKLQQQGIYYITGQIDTNSLLEIQQDILLKHMTPSWNQDIQLIINSVGGSIPEGNAFIDLLDWIRMDVRTVAMGWCASMGACLACCGTPGKRLVSPSASIMIHGAQWGIWGTRHDIAVIAKEMEREHLREIAFWIKHSKYKTQEEIEKHFLHGTYDVFMSAQEALQHGIFDGIIGQEINKPINTEVTKKNKKSK